MLWNKNSNKLCFYQSFNIDKIIQKASENLIFIEVKNFYFIVYVSKDYYHNNVSIEVLHHSTLFIIFILANFFKKKLLLIWKYWNIK